MTGVHLALRCSHLGSHRITMCIEARGLSRIVTVKLNHANRGRDKLSHYRQVSDALVHSNREDAKRPGTLPLRFSAALVIRWLIGLLIGTTLIAVTSPWFTRSYLPLVVDPVRQTWVLSPGSEYRWRSEGYANTKIGPLGLPGKLSSSGPDWNLINRPPLPADGRSPVLRIAMWGDSQVEGVCLDDSDKLFAITERLCGGVVEVFPLARSGQDAADWVTQMPAVERALQIDLHVMVLADLEDALAAEQAPLAPPSESDVAAANAAIAARFPAFVIQAARNLLTDSDGVSPRRLRFGLGPVGTGVGSASNATVINGVVEIGGPSPVTKPQSAWNAAVSSMKRATAKPIWLVDAPVSPQVVDGRVQTRTLQAPDFIAMQEAVTQHGVRLLSARERFREEASFGRWPHGFQNGRIGSGHLNAHGNRLIAEILAKAILTIPGVPSSAAADQPTSALGD